MDPPKINV